MKFKIDENLPDEIADFLRSANHEADTAADEELIGEPDERIITACMVERRCLITLDLDFSDLRTYPPGGLNGIIVFRLKSQDKFHVIETVKRLLRVLEDEELSGRLWIVDENRIRIRGQG